MSDYLEALTADGRRQIIALGTADERAARLRRQQAYGEALRNRSAGAYTNPWAAALGGAADITNSLVGAYQQRQAMEGLSAIDKERAAGRQALLDAYAGGMRRNQVTAPDVVAPNIGMPDATPEQRAMAEALRGKQQESREAGVRQGTAYLGLLSGDEGLRSFSNALLRPEENNELRALALAQSGERLRQQAEAEKRRYGLAEERLSFQKTQAQQQQERAQSAAAAKKVADALGIEEGLRKEVMGNPVTRSYLEAQVAFDKVQRAAQDPSAAGDLALIFGVMKTLDPGSTVREGEFANAQNAGGIDDRFVSAYNKVLRGERLSEQQRADFVRTARGQFATHQGAFQRFVEGYKGVAQRAGAKVENVLPLGSTPRVSAPASTPGSGAPDMDLSAPQAPTALSPTDAAALDWARANPADPRAGAILKRLGVTQ